MPQKTASSKRPNPEKRRASGARTAAKKPPRGRLPVDPDTRPQTVIDEDVLPSGGSTTGVAFGRCGGRVLSSRLEQRICDLLSHHGVTHSHSPRHFEVRLDENRVAAYAPMIVLRGRGREGKTVVIEACEATDPSSLSKVRAFRGQYGVEFYLCFVAPEDVLDDVRFDTYDEAATTTDVHTLISRLAD